MEFIIKTKIKASADKIYTAWLNSEAHTKMTGGNAVVSSREEGEFSTWDGYISGKNIVLKQNISIKQSWRTSGFKETDEDSILELNFNETDGETEITLIHSNLPNDGEQYKKGWDIHYFEPMKKYFSNKSNKVVKYLLPAVEVDMGGIPLKQPLPTSKISQIDPFLLLHHANFTYNNLSHALHQGIGPHPHRGFSPVTFVIEGEVHHRDSRGNNQIARKGEVQWMHAGAGIVHSERPSQSLVDKNGYQEIIQLWINSPASKKMKQPNYQFTKASDIPVFLSADKQIENKLIAGNYKGVQSKTDTESELLVIWAKTNTKGSQLYDIPKNYNSMIYLISGELRIVGYGKVEKEHLVVFENTDGNIEISTDSNANFLLLCGMPIKEKIAQQGPFVMNTQTEIMEAMRDYQMGKMGVLIE